MTGTTITQDDITFFESMSFSKWQAAEKYVDGTTVAADHPPKVTPAAFGGSYWRNEPTQYFWLVSQVAAFATAPNTRLETALQQELKKLDFDTHGPVLGLHVRLGDACSDPQFAEVRKSYFSKCDSYVSISCCANHGIELISRRGGCACLCTHTCPR